MEPEVASPYLEGQSLHCILSQFSSVRNFTSYFSKIHFSIILSSTPMPSKWSLPLRFSDQNVNTLAISSM